MRRSSTNHHSFLLLRRRVIHTMADLYSSIHYWPVDHPMISQYEWKQGHTLGSSPRFLSLTVLTYLTLTLTLTLKLSFNNNVSTLPNLRLITAVHSLILCLLSLIMAVGCSLSALHQMPPNDYTWIVFLPSNYTPPRGPTFFWAHVFYFSKILEFIDTLLTIFSGSSPQRLSFLHVFHHSMVMITSYLWLSTSQSMFIVGLVTNASVHVVMYAYYFLSALGIRPWWKKLVTNVQIIQFVFGLLVAVLMLYYHFTGPGCSGIWSWCFSVTFTVLLLVLFVDFHTKNYAKKGKYQSKHI